jgi:hypothetical protein
MEWDVWELFILSTQFFCKSKIVLKIKALNLKENSIPPVSQNKNLSYSSHSTETRSNRLVADVDKKRTEDREAARVIFQHPSSLHTHSSRVVTLLS